MIPASARRVIYLVLAIAGLALGATQVGYASVSIDAPAWLTVATAVYGFLSGGGGILAVLNTPPADLTQISPATPEPSAIPPGASS